MSVSARKDEELYNLKREYCTLLRETEGLFAASADVSNSPAITGDHASKRTEESLEKRKQSPDKEPAHETPAKKNRASEDVMVTEEHRI